MALRYLSVERFADTAQDGRRVMWSSHTAEVPTCKDRVMGLREEAKKVPRDGYIER